MLYTFKGVYVKENGGTGHMFSMEGHVMEICHTRIFSSKTFNISRSWQNTFPFHFSGLFINRVKIALYGWMSIF